MSRRTAAADKAVRLAWKREYELVSTGQGTRDWTPEQQKTILDPDIGKAYDENGVPFQGQHMKSVEEYPEYQGDPDNIQFLSRKEHFDAHKGSWQNPTNWYYNPVTMEYFDFGEDAPIPCAVIQLSDPVILFDKSYMHEVASEVMQAEEKPSSGTDPPANNTLQSEKIDEAAIAPTATVSIDQEPKPRTIDGIKNIANTVKNFSDKHPVATALVKLGVGAVGVYFTSKVIGSTSKTKYAEHSNTSALLSKAVDSLGETATNVINSFDFKESESILKGLGYSVAKKMGLSDSDRQRILEKIISTNVLSKESVCKYLENYINLHKNQGSFTDAVEKWVADLEFIKNNL